MIDLLLLLWISTPVPALLWLAAFTERKRLYKNILQEELVNRTQRGRTWKKKVLK